MVTGVTLPAYFVRVYQITNKNVFTLQYNQHKKLPQLNYWLAINFPHLMRLHGK